MRKVILSRKGIDDTYGKGASPILPDGRLLSLPIPAQGEEGIPYRHLEIDLNGAKQSLQAIADQLGLKHVYGECHLDPDLGTYDDATKFRGAFGQKDAALKHLENNKVGEGDVFLFFGSFRPTYFDESGKLCWRKIHAVHIIFGYLIVESFLSADELRSGNVDADLKQHPHVVNAKKYKSQNGIYLSRKADSFGTFQFHEKLVLTKPRAYKSHWEVPSFFYSGQREGVTSISYHTEKHFEEYDGRLHLSAVPRGQEFVVTGGQDLQCWVREIIRKGNGED